MKGIDSLAISNLRCWRIMNYYNTLHIRDVLAEALTRHHLRPTRTAEKPPYCECQPKRLE